MVGQPDWQRYQTTSGPLIVQLNNVTLPSSPMIYVGSWQSLFVFITNQDSGQLKRVTFSFFEDSAGLQGVFARHTVIGNGSNFTRRIPVYARYMQVTSAQIIGGTTNLCSLWVAPSSGPETPLYIDDPTPLITAINTNVPASGEVDLFPNRVASGLVQLNVWQTSASLRYNIRWFDAGGTLQYLAVVSWSSVNVINSIQLCLPDTPVTVQVNNTDGAAAHLCHVTLLPAA